MNRMRLVAIFGFCFTVFTAPDVSAVQPLKLGIHPYLSATEIVGRFRPLANYLAGELKTPVEIEIADSYATHVRNVGTGAVDVGFMGPVSYVLLVQEHGPRPILAAFQTGGKKTFRGVVVADRTSGIATLDQLRGKRFAFGDPHSTMSHLVPRWMLLRQGIGISDLAGHAFLSNHDNIALGVLAGNFDAGALKEDVFRQYEKEGLKAVAFSEEFADHVFVMSARTPAQTAEAARRALLALGARKEGREILAAIQKDLEALVPAADRDYDNLRRVLETLKAVGVEP